MTTKMWVIPWRHNYLLCCDNTRTEGAIFSLPRCRSQC